MRHAFAFAVVAFFARRGEGWRFSTGVAPCVGGLGLTVAVVLVAADFRLLSNSDSWVLNALPALYGIIAVAGAVYATWLPPAVVIRESHDERLS